MEIHLITALSVALSADTGFPLMAGMSSVEIIEILAPSLTLRTAFTVLSDRFVWGGNSLLWGRNGRLALGALKMGSEQSLIDGAAGIYLYCGHWIHAGRTGHGASRNWCRAYLVEY